MVQRQKQEVLEIWAIPATLPSDAHELAEKRLHFKTLTLTFLRLSEQHVRRVTT